VATREVGWPGGTSAGVALAVAEYDPVAEEFTAATLKEYDVPLVKPVTNRVVDVDHVLEVAVTQDTPPLDEYSIL
jgi:hypothetical protein